MNRRDLVQAVSTQAGVDRKDVDTVLKGFTDVVTAVVSKGEAVSISGFAKFVKVDRPARMGRNPQTQQPVRIKASKKARITPLKGFKDAVVKTSLAPKLNGRVAAGPGRQGPRRRRRRPPPRRPRPRPRRDRRELRRRRPGEEDDGPQDAGHGQDGDGPQDHRHQDVGQAGRRQGSGQERRRQAPAKKAPAKPGPPGPQGAGPGTRPRAPLRRATAPRRGADLGRSPLRGTAMRKFARMPTRPVRLERSWGSVGSDRGL